MSTAFYDEVLTIIEESGETGVEETSAPEEANTRPKFLPPYAVVLHDDDINSPGFVVQTLQKVFGYDRPKAMYLVSEVELRGQFQVWTGAKEHAEFKADQIISRGPDPMVSAKIASPLRVTIEPLPV